MDIAHHIEINPKILMGKPVIKGTRISVEMILEKLSAGETENDLLQAHPHITKEDIKDGKYAVMEANKMTCEQTKQIDLVDFLNSLGFNLVKTRNNLLPLIPVLKVIDNL
jgi:uncharacterized protein (DUF433 family)